MTTGARVALRNDSYTLHLLLPTKVDPLVSLMKVEKVPDSTYDMIGGLDQQIKEIKEVRRRWCPIAAAQPGSLVCFLLGLPSAVAKSCRACQCQVTLVDSARVTKGAVCHCSCGFVFRHGVTCKDLQSGGRTLTFIFSLCR